MSENIRQVLKVEHRIEGGCEVLLDKEQTLIREGWCLSPYITARLGEGGGGGGEGEVVRERSGLGGRKGRREGEGGPERALVDWILTGYGIPLYLLVSMETNRCLSWQL